MIKLPIINRIFPSYKSKIIAVIVTGVIVGGGVLFMYMLRAHTYLGDDPAACVNCHIMSPYYATWFHSSHARDATCNDCHVPHENAVKKWTFKGIDGMKHVAAFLTKSEPQVIQAHEASSQVIMNNCIRCHTQLNTEFVKTGKIDYMSKSIIRNSNARTARRVAFTPTRSPLGKRRPIRSFCRFSNDFTPKGIPFRLAIISFVYPKAR